MGDPLASPQPEGGGLPLPSVLKADTQPDCCGGPSKALTDGPCNTPLTLVTSTQVSLSIASLGQVRPMKCLSL